MTWFAESLELKGEVNRQALKLPAVCKDSGHRDNNNNNHVDRELAAPPRTGTCALVLSTELALGARGGTGIDFVGVGVHACDMKGHGSIQGRAVSLFDFLPILLLRSRKRVV